MPKKKYEVDDDSLTRPGRGAPERADKPERNRGEAERARDPEPGRHDAAPKGPARRPRGTSSGRDTTSIDPQDPIDPRSPNLR